MKWIELIKYNLNVEIQYPIIADEMGKTANTLGLIHPVRGSNTDRAVFVVDPNGKIKAIL
jgi:peroxiredoxin (alkyl hydroperoxide reductase subunit C)